MGRPSSEILCIHNTTWPPDDLLTPQEKVIKGAVEEVLSRICSILGDIWVDAFNSEETGVKELEGFLVKWESGIAELMDWLDRSIWIKCDAGCGPEVSFWLAFLADLLSLQSITGNLLHSDLAVGSPY